MNATEFVEYLNNSGTNSSATLIPKEGSRHGCIRVVPADQPDAEPYQISLSPVTGATISAVSDGVFRNLSQAELAMLSAHMAALRTRRREYLTYQQLPPELRRDDIAFDRTLISLRGGMQDVGIAIPSSFLPTPSGNTVIKSFSDGSTISLVERPDGAGWFRIDMISDNGVSRAFL